MSDNDDGQIKIEFPKRCSGCGRKFKGKAKQFVMIALPVPGLSLFGCVHCYTVMTNPNAFSNLVKIQEKNAKQQALTQVKTPLFGMDGKRIN